MKPVLNNFFENFLPKAIFISLAVHLVLVGGSAFMQFPVIEKAKVKGVEVSYKPDMKKAPDMRQHPIKPSQQLDLKNSTSEGAIPLNLAKENQGLTNKFMMYERKPEQQIKSSQMAHRVRITPITSAKINNPAYAAYNEMVRNRIEEKVYENYRKMEAGSIYLTFIISSDGILRDAQIIPEKSQGSVNLESISMLSLKQARFPPFYKGMTLPEYTFNIEVQYQVQN